MTARKIWTFSMGIALDAETESFARRLATLRGETVEEAVKMAVRAELARAEPALSPTQQANIDKMMSIVNSLPKLNLPDDEDPTAFLYDDFGLPR